MRYVCTPFPGPPVPKLRWAPSRYACVVCVRVRLCVCVCGMCACTRLVGLPVPDVEGGLLQVVDRLLGQRVLKQTTWRRQRHWRHPRRRGLTWCVTRCVPLNPMHREGEIRFGLLAKGNWRENSSGWWTIFGTKTCFGQVGPHWPVLASIEMAFQHVSPGVGTSSFFDQVGPFSELYVCMRWQVS